MTNVTAAGAAAAAPVADREVPKLLKYLGDSGSICVALRYAAAASAHVRRQHEQGRGCSGCTGGCEVAAALVRVTEVEPRASIVVVHRDDAQIHARGGGGAASLREKNITTDVSTGRMLAGRLKALAPKQNGSAVVKNCGTGLTCMSAMA